MSDEEKDPLDVESALERLGAALPLQLRSAAAYTVASGAITGFQYMGLTDLLWRFAQQELEHVRRLVEKVVTLGGRPPTAVPEFDLPDEPDGAIERLIGFEREALEALQDVI